MAKQEALHRPALSRLRPFRGFGKTKGITGERALHRPALSRIPESGRTALPCNACRALNCRPGPAIPLAPTMRARRRSPGCPQRTGTHAGAATGSGELTPSTEMRSLGPGVVVPLLVRRAEAAASSGHSFRINSRFRGDSDLRLYYAHHTQLGKLASAARAND